MKKLFLISTLLILITFFIISYSFRKEEGSQSQIDYTKSREVLETYLNAQLNNELTTVKENLVEKKKDNNEYLYPPIGAKENRIENVFKIDEIHVKIPVYTKIEKQKSKFEIKQEFILVYQDNKWLIENKKYIEDNKETKGETNEMDVKQLVEYYLDRIANSTKNNLEDQFFEDTLSRNKRKSIYEYKESYVIKGFEVSEPKIENNIATVEFKLNVDHKINRETKEKIPESGSIKDKFKLILENNKWRIDDGPLGLFYVVYLHKARKEL